MFNFQGQEVFIIFVLALIVLGPERLPEAMRKLGNFVAEVRKATGGFQQEFKAVVDEPMRQMRESVDMIRDQTDIRKWQTDSTTSGGGQTSSEGSNGSDTPAVKPLTPGGPVAAEPTTSFDPTPNVPTFESDVDTTAALVGDTEVFAVTQSSNTDLREWVPTANESDAARFDATDDATTDGTNDSQLLRDLTTTRQTGPFTDA